jgi:selenocysteine lyase/cysteine desulfurase
MGTEHMALVGDGLRVPLVGGSDATHLNLDFAASAPALVAVQRVVEEFLPWYASVHRGSGFKSQLSTEAFESARSDVAAFVNARPDDVVVFTRNTTDSLNLLSAAVPDGTRVVVFDTEHHANLLPWRRREVTHLQTPADPSELVGVLDDDLAADRRPALVAVTGASNVTGELWPVGDLVAAAHARGARVVVDAAQLAPHAPVDLAGWDADWVVFSGHKLYAPYGAGALVGRREWLSTGEPYLRGGGAVVFVTLDDVTWTQLPDRQEAGSPNVVGAVAMAAACRALEGIGMQRIADEEIALERVLSNELDTVPGLTRYRTWSADHPRIAIATFNLEGMHHSQVAAALSAEYGISVRNGCFCAHPLLLRLLHVAGSEADAVRDSMQAGCLKDVPGAVRVSGGLPTTPADVARLGDALRDLADRGPRWTYRQTEAGDFLPEPDDRELPPLACLTRSAPMFAEKGS